MTTHLDTDFDGVMVSEYYYDDDDDAIVEYRRQPSGVIEGIVERNRLFRDAVWRKGWRARPRTDLSGRYGRLVARVPLEVWEMWHRLKGVRLGDKDQARIKALLNDPDNAAFRTYPGRL